MKSSRPLVFLLVIFSITSLASCVAKKEYDALAARKSALEVEKASCEDSLNYYKGQAGKLSKENADLGQQLEAVKTSYTQLEEQYNNLSKAANADARKLSEQLERTAQLNRELEEKDRLIDIEEQRISALRTDLETREQQIKDLESELAARDSSVQALRNRINNALLGFSSSDLTVEVRDGKVYVSLAEKLLFPSGKYEVNPEGKSALAKLAKVLTDSKDEFDVLVEGHTDDVPMSAGSVIKDNWDLSVLRATSITRVLQDNGIAPGRLIASGRSQYKPKVQGKTPEARAANRRTEIILSPRLDELFQILDGKK